MRRFRDKQAFERARSCAQRFEHRLDAVYVRGNNGTRRLMMFSRFLFE